MAWISCLAEYMFRMAGALKQRSTPVVAIAGLVIDNCGWNGRVRRELGRVPDSRRAILPVRNKLPKNSYFLPRHISCLVVPESLSIIRSGQKEDFYRLLCDLTAPSRKHLYHLDIKPIHHNALGPGPLHDAGDLLGRLLRNHGANKVQSRIDAGADAAARDDAEPAQAHGGTTGNGLLAAVGALPRHTALSGPGG